MQRLEVSCAVRHAYMSLGAKGLIEKHPVFETYIYTVCFGSKLFFRELVKVLIGNQFCPTHYIGLTDIPRY